MIDDLALVHRYDQRGSGRSRSLGPFEVSSFIEDLEALRAHWRHDRWVVGGHSWGANLALFYALAHPNRTLGVIYIAGTGIKWGWQEHARAYRLARLTEDELTELTEIENEIATGNMSRQARFLRLMWSTDFADRANASVLERQPLYEFPRNEAVFQAASKSYRAALHAGTRERRPSPRRPAARPPRRGGLRPHASPAGRGTGTARRMGGTTGRCTLAVARATPADGSTAPPVSDEMHLSALPRGQMKSKNESDSK